VSVTGTFLRGSAGQILVVSHEPEETTNRTIVVVPAFAEEMNKSRRLVWSAGAALAKRGIRTVTPDLYGTGDSDGDFAFARWDIWLEDLSRTVEWASSQGTERFSVLLVRMGAALFADAEKALGVTFDRAVAWQPIRNGADVVRQWLRMKSMSIRMAGGQAESAEALLARLLGGTEPMELGGYPLSPGLAASLRQAAFAERDITSVERGLVIELGAAFPALPDASETASDTPTAWQRMRIGTERFWMEVEPSPNPELVTATVEFLGA
jgi:exosortase A-associated hydrolase 2